MVRVWRHIFHILRNNQSACSRINLLYLGHGLLNNRSTRSAAEKENWVSEFLQDQTGNCWSLSQEISFREEVLAVTWLFFQIGGWNVARYGKIFVLLYLILKFVVDKIPKHEFFSAFYFHHAHFDMGNRVLYFDMQVFSLFIQMRTGKSLFYSFIRNCLIGRIWRPGNFI